VLPAAIVGAAKNRAASWKTFKTVTLLSSILAFFALGWLHQGGVLPALSDLHLRLKATESTNPDARFNVVSYSTYMLPRHLLFHPSDSKVSVHVDDLVGGQNNPAALKATLEALRSQCKGGADKCVNFVLMAAPALGDLKGLSEWSVKEEHEFCPHVSAERLPSNVKLDDLYTEDGRRLLLPQLCLKLVSLKF
jgi:hypothetical protein